MRTGSETSGIKFFSRRRRERESVYNINHSKILFDPLPRVMKIKPKINKWDLIKLKKILHNKGNYKQGEKTAFRMGENNNK